MGDLDEFAREIDDVGVLLQPVVISHERLLLDGRRRYNAWPRCRISDYGKLPIPVIWIDVDKLRADGLPIEKVIEYAANVHRKNFTLSEQCQRWLEIEPALKEAAKRRQQAGQGAKDDKDKGRVRDHMRRATGLGSRSPVDLQRLLQCAQAEPIKYGDLVRRMDENGADGAHKSLKNLQSAERIRVETPPLPMHGPYRVIGADPPWPPEANAKRPYGRNYYPYPPMSLDEIASLDVRSIAHEEGCGLWLWATNHVIANGFHVPILRAWGFMPSSTILTWTKTSDGTGQRLRGASEQCVLAVRGHVPLNPRHPTWFRAPAGAEHSAKPMRFYKIVEEVMPVSRYAMLFAGRALPPKWDGHGDRIGRPAGEGAP